MPHVNEKYYTAHSQLWKDNFWQKNGFKNANILMPEVLFMERNIFMFFSSLKDIIQTQYKTIHWISHNLMIICLKGISEECFSFNV